jgi:hypothetical protein
VAFDHAEDILVVQCVLGVIPAAIAQMYAETSTPTK